MNKYELKYMLEQMSSSVDRLTDVAGKQQHHIAELWEEIGQKNTRINALTNKIYELQKKINAQSEKNWAEHIFPERVDN